MKPAAADLLLSSLALVQLDVASPWMTAAQITAGEVAARQLDLEYVVAARLALVAHAHPRGAGLSVNINIVVNDAAIGVGRIDCVSGDGGGLHVHSVAVVNVIEMAPERVVLESAAHAEVGLRARRRAGDPSAARHEVAPRRCAGFTTAR